MNIICGKCTGRHASVAEVKSCYFAPVPVSIPVSTPVTEPGMYQNGDDIYKVVWNKNKTFLYAKKLMVAGIGDKVKGYFTFTAGAIKYLTAEMRMDLAGAVSYAQKVAEKYGVGVCCQCGRTLTNKDSIDAGIGPICSGKI